MSADQGRTRQLLRYLPLGAVIVIGLGVLAAPVVAAFDGWARGLYLVTGPLIASLATIALGAATRGARWANVVLGALLAVAALLVGESPIATWTGVAAGLAAALLSLDPGPPRPSFGGGWRALVDVERLARDRR